MLNSHATQKTRKKLIRVHKSLPHIPDGLTVREKLLYVKVPLTAAMLAEILGVSVESVYKAARAHRLPTLPRLAGVRFDGVEVARLMFEPIAQKSAHKERSAYSKIAERKSIIKVLWG